MSDNSYKNLSDLTRNYDVKWYNHYVSYLSNLVYQLFEWKNLPDTVDPRFLETRLHRNGKVAFHYDKKVGYIVLEGTPVGKLNHYGVMGRFQAVTPYSEEITRNFAIYHYLNQNESMVNPLTGILEPDKTDYGVLIQNNDMERPTMEAVKLFAIELTEIKSVIRTNVLAQKTPLILAANDTNLHSVKQLYNKIEGNVPVIITDKTLDLDTLKVHLTPAPYVGDKLNTLKNTVWNDFMTYLGINNANLEKKERMVVQEATSNDDQIQASGNIMLKARKEACERINWLYPDLNIDVELRHDVLDALENEVTKLGDVHNPITNIN